MISMVYVPHPMCTHRLDKVHDVTLLPSYQIPLNIRCQAPKDKSSYDILAYKN